MVKNCFLVLTCLLATFFWLGCGSKKVVPEGTVLAEFKCNDEKQFVTLEELEHEIVELPKYKQNKYSDLEGKKEYLTLMVESRLILEMAKSRDLDKDSEILKQVENTFQKLMVEKITEEEVDKKVKVTEEDLKQYYEKHKEDYIEPEKVKVTVICLDDKELAENSFKQISEESKDMKELARELLNDQRLVGVGTNPREPGSIEFSLKSVPEAWKLFGEASFELKVGEVYPEIMELEIQDTKYYLIFKKEEHKPERQKEFQKVRAKVEREVEKQKRKERMNEWISEIRNEAKVKEYQDRIPVLPKEEKSEEVVKETDTNTEKDTTETTSEESEEVKEKTTQEKTEESKKDIQ